MQPFYNINFLFFVIASMLLCSCQKSGQPQFTKLDAAQTGITFVNELDTTKQHRALYFFYYFNGGGVATGDINNDGLIDIFFTSNTKGKNKLYLNKGQLRFDDITASAGILPTADWCSGVTMADVNNDGFLDIYVSTVNHIFDFKGHNALYINNHNNTFTEAAAQYGLAFSGYATQASFFDYDGDGDLDCYLLNQSQKPNENLKDISFRQEAHPYAGDRLMRNDVSTSGKFVDVSKEAGIYQSSLGYGLGIATADINHDGCTDIYVGNDFHENDYCYINNCDGTFTESGATLFNHYSRFSMGNDIQDFDNDGQPDIFTVDMLPHDEKILKTYSSGETFDMYDFIIKRNGYQTQFSRNCLQRNNGMGKSFSDVALMYDIYDTDWSWSPLIADYDNDGFKDIFISAGIPKRTVDLDYAMYVNNIRLQPGQDPRPVYDRALKLLPDGACHNVMFKGKGINGFVNVSKDWGMTDLGYHTGAAHADFDNDGDLDLVVNAINSTAFIYKNNNKQGSYISVHLKGSKLNPFGIGAKVWCITERDTLYSEMQSVKGFQSSSTHAIHFGIDSTDHIKQLFILWPDKKIQTLHNPKINTTVIVNAQDAIASKEPIPYINTVGNSDSFSLTDQVKGDVHVEDNFNDFQYQDLLPHQLSKMGPKIAVADVNGDGLQDYYSTKAKAQVRTMMVQQKGGTFVALPSFPKGEKVAVDETDAIFFDANNDGHQDLIVVCGGNDASIGATVSMDKLYINDGKGHFVSAPLPPLPQSNRSAVAAGDMDDDGDDDLIIACHSKIAAYGLPQPFYLLYNDGKGTFTTSQSPSINTLCNGFITDITLADVNSDKSLDIIVAGEWMNVTIYLNKGNNYSASLLDGSGLWQCVTTADYNGDGLIDVLAGNWGLNAKLKATNAEPLHLYVHDFDKNGKNDLVLTHFSDGLQYPFLGKDELDKAMPSLKKKYLKFSDFAGKTFEEIFESNANNAKKYSADFLESAVYLQNKNGSFSRQSLPWSAQLMPIFSFEKFNGQYFAGGGFTGVRPYEGYYDAASLVAFTQPLHSSIVDTKGEVRSMAVIKVNGTDKLLIAKNNGMTSILNLDSSSNGTMHNKTINQ